MIISTILLLALVIFINTDFPYRLILKFSRFTAINHPWKCKTIWETEKDFELASPELIAEEQAHICQIRIKHAEYGGLLGGLVYAISYLYYGLRYGYDKNPYEVEAKKKANEI